MLLIYSQDYSLGGTHLSVRQTILHSVSSDALLSWATPVDSGWFSPGQSVLFLPVGWNGRILDPCSSQLMTSILK